MDKVPLTTSGAGVLRSELQRLKTEERPKIIEAIAIAREHGDLKENAEYHAAREQQSFCEGRIKELDGILSNAQIIDCTTINADGKIIFGCTVDLVDEGTSDAVTYQIVGDPEANIKVNKIAISSPVARALIGKYEGDIAKVAAPSGDKSYEIIAVHYL
ncbi:MAG: transcription elongation factor GreA [Gammaproteobacteria bacterium]|nr:transcription elongation factor GreA [Gammaproteobacteria bacterium]